MSEVSELLEKIGRGDREATSRLLPLVYDELKRIAAAKLRHEPSGHTLQATALVHEAYLRLTGADQDAAIWDKELHFLAAAAEAMRRVLVDHARSKKRIKRGSGVPPQSLDSSKEPLATLRIPEELLDLDDALKKLATLDPTAVELVHLRYFAGLTNAEAAESLGISPRTANRLWVFAKTWLFTELGQD